MAATTFVPSVRRGVPPAGVPARSRPAVAAHVPAAGGRARSAASDGSLPLGLALLVLGLAVGLAALATIALVVLAPAMVLALGVQLLSRMSSSSGVVR